MQARAALVQSQNRYISSWKQMAAAVGIPGLPPSTLADRVDMPLPDLNFDALLEQVLNVYPDAQAARNLEAQARFNLRLQQVTPVPDVTVYAGFFKDYTDPDHIRPGTYNMTVTVPIPVFDKNLGNILSADGRLLIAAEQLRVVRNQLTAQLADAFERFQTNRVQAQFYQEQILPDLRDPTAAFTNATSRSPISSPLATSSLLSRIWRTEFQRTSAFSCSSGSQSPTSQTCSSCRICATSIARRLPIPHPRPNKSPHHDLFNRQSHELAAQPSISDSAIGDVERRPWSDSAPACRAGFTCRGVGSCAGCCGWRRLAVFVCASGGGRFEK